MASAPGSGLGGDLTSSSTSSSTSTATAAASASRSSSSTTPSNPSSSAELLSATMPSIMPRVVPLIDALVAVCGRDIGGRGIAFITRPSLRNELVNAAMDLLLAPSVAILTGFPCRLNDTPPTETDGPPGALAIAHVCATLNKAAVSIVTDECNADVIRACVAARGLDGRVAVQAFPPGPSSTEVEAARLADIAETHVHTCAIERAGAAADGDYCTMRAFSMRHLVAPLDPLLTNGTRAGGAVAPTRTSTGIGDGGNEAGMGAVLDAVRAHIPLGDKIACVTPADNLITAGVSNWGGWALVAATQLVARACIAGAAAGETPASVTRVVSAIPEDVQAGLASRGLSLLPSETSERALADAMIATGARDGITGNCDGSVDGMPLQTHLDVLREFRDIAAAEL